MTVTTPTRRIVRATREPSRARRAVIYTRVSRDRFKTGRSPAEQERECREFCDEQGWDVVEVFTDDDRSASRHARKEREAFKALIAWVNLGDTDVIVCWENSRGTRRLDEFLEVRTLCEEMAILYAYSGNVYDMRKWRDRRDASRDAVDAEAESEQTRERVMRNVRSNARKGRPHGKNIFGYGRTYDPVTKELVRVHIVDAEADVIREAARRVLTDGHTLYAIAQDFDARGLPAPGKRGWIPETIKRVLVNPAYARIRIHQGSEVATETEHGGAIWPAILSEADHRALVVKLKDPSRLTRYEGPATITHLGTHIYECGVCETPLRLIKSRGIPSYCCMAPGNGPDDKGYHVTRKQGWYAPDSPVLVGVDDYVNRVLIARLSRPDALDLLRAPEDQGEAAGESVAVLRAELKGYADLAGQGRLTPETMATVEAGYLARIAKAEQRVRPRELPAALPTLVEADDVEAAWLALPMSVRRDVLRTVARVQILKTNRGKRRIDADDIRIGWRTADGGTVWTS